MPYPLLASMRPRRCGALGSASHTPLTGGVEQAVDELLPALDFTEWYQPPGYTMTATSPLSFTNGGTGYIQKDVGAEAGKTYRVTLDQARGAGTCLIYFAADQGVTQAAQVWGLEGGAEVIDLVADGPWLTFRASVGATTTIFTALSVVEVTA